MSRASGKRRFLYLTIAIIGIAIVMTFRWLGSSRSADFETGYRQAEQFYADGQLEQAKGVLKQLFERDHTDSPALLLSAKIYHETGQLEDAIQELDLIEHRSDRIWDEARQLKAEILHYELYHFQLAEEVYLEILSESPDDVFANDGYARLLGLCGRRWEAIPHVLRLIRAGQTTDLLMLLSRESGSLINSKMLETARRNHPEDPNPLLGLAHAANSSQDYQRSLQLLRQAESLPGLPDNFHGQLGQQLLNCDETSELKQWFQEFSADPQSFESWMLLGQISSSAGNQKSAIRCFWEAVRMQPESLQGNHQLAQSLITEKEIELAELFTQRVRLINQLRDIQRATIMVNHTPSQEDILELIQAYRQVGRLWEAYAWARSALLANPRNQKLIETVNSLSQEMIDLPLQLTQAKFNPAQELDFSHYPLPETFQTMGEQSLPANSLSLSFQNESANRGFHFEYYDGTPGTTYRMFELTGGGIAALDYDRDGAPDIFCSQGRAWDGQQTNSPAQTDRLFRNREGRSYQDVTAFAGFLNENGFGQGVSAGDYNNDGFVDLYVAQTGTNRLWKNNGDGTFSDATTDIKMQETRWTTSCLIADINGDSYPDLYDVNYLSAIDLFDRVCRDRKNIDDLCVPTDFDPASDRIWLGKGDGTFTDHTQDLLPESTNGKGLGIWRCVVSMVACLCLSLTIPWRIIITVFLLGLPVRWRMLPLSMVWHSTELVKLKAAWEWLLRTVIATGFRIFTFPIFCMNPTRCIAVPNQACSMIGLKNMDLLPLPCRCWGLELNFSMLTWMASKNCFSLMATPTISHEMGYLSQCHLISIIGTALVFINCRWSKSILVKLTALWDVP
jgi:tetratricopeptide (TPR) repeat protein